MKTVETSIINHICILLDASSSMSHLKSKVVEMTDKTIQHLKELSEKNEQETRISIFSFSGRGTFDCLIFDKDVFRLPSISGLYNTNGMTALIDATIKCVDDLKLTCQKYGQHSFLFYCITDGDENASLNTANALNKTLLSLPDNWTVAALVPNEDCKKAAITYGFIPTNVAVWNTSSKGLEEVGDVLKTTTTNYMQARSTGARSLKDLFSLKIENLNTTNVKKALKKLKPSDFAIFANTGKAAVEIKPLIESFGGRYNKDDSYYQLVKIEHVQDYKKLALQEKTTGDVYVGKEVRAMLGLPENQLVKVAPVQHDQYNIFVQSTAQNRKIIPGSAALTFK